MAGNSVGRGAALMVALALLLPGCTWFIIRDLGREEPLERGAISGRLVRVDQGSEPAAFAKVQVVGASRAARADSDGDFVLRALVEGSWPLRIVDDPDGDGWPERTRIQGARLALLPHASTPVDVVIGGGTDVSVSGVLLGNVDLEKAGALEGTVTYDAGPLPAGILAKVVATRALAIDRPDVGDVETLLLGAEAITHADANGVFYFGGLGSGQVRVVALLYKIVDDVPVLVEITEVGEAVVSPRPDDSAPVDDAGALNAAGDLETELEESTPVVLAVTPPPTGASMSVVLVPPGTAFPPCEEPQILDYAGTPFDHARVIDVPSQARPNVEIPLGAWDVQVCDGDRAGRLRGQVAFRFASPPTWGPLFIGGEEGQCQSWQPSERNEACETDEMCAAAEGETVSCRPTAEVNLLGGQVLRCFTLLEDDCDGDGVSGLPQPVGFDDPLWSACEAACTGLLGAAADEVVCETVDGETTRVWDCDDDGDGQADVDERNCYGVDLGDDLDTDGICTPVDLFPLCRANTREACAARANDAAAGYRLALDETFAGGASGGEALPGGAVVEATAVTASSTGRVFAVGRAGTGVGPVQTTVWAMGPGDVTFGPARAFEALDDPFLNDADPFDAALLTRGELDPRLLVAGELVSDPFVGGVESRAALWEIQLDEGYAVLDPLVIDDGAPWLLDYQNKDGSGFDPDITDARATAVASVPGNETAALVAMEGDDAGAFIGVWNPGATLLWSAGGGMARRLVAVQASSGLLEASARAIAVGTERVFVAGSAVYGANPEQSTPVVYAFDLAAGEVTQNGELPQSVAYLDEDLRPNEQGIIEDLVTLTVGATRLLIGVGIVEDDVGSAYPVVWRFELGANDSIAASTRWRLDDYNLMVGRSIGGATTVAAAGPGQIIVGGAVAYAPGAEQEPALEAAAWLLGMTGPATEGPRVASPPLLAATDGAGGETGLLFNSITPLPDGRFVAVGEAMGIADGARAWRLRLVADDGEGGGTDMPLDPEPDMMAEPDMMGEPDVAPVVCDPLDCQLDCEAGSTGSCVVQTGACACVDEACAGRWTYDGDVDEAADTAALSTATCVAGSVTLTGAEAQELASSVASVELVLGSLTLGELPGDNHLTVAGLREVRGDVVMLSTTTVDVVDVTDMETVGGSLSIVNNTALTGMTFPGTRVTGPVTITGNTSWCQDSISQLGVVPMIGTTEQDNLCCGGNCDTLGDVVLTCGMGVAPLCEAP